VNLRHGSAQALDLLYLRIEYLLSLPAHLLPYKSVEVYGRHRSPDVHDVQLGAGAFGQACGGSGSKLCVAGTIGSQKDLGRKDAH
jgi:hypothetical protein